MQSTAAVLSTSHDVPIPPRALTELLLGVFSRERLVKMDVPVVDVIFGWRLNTIYDVIQKVGLDMGLTFPPEMQNGKFGFYLDVRIDI